MTIACLYSRATAVHTWHNLFESPNFESLDFEFWRVLMDWGGNRWTNRYFILYYRCNMVDAKNNFQMSDIRSKMSDVWYENSNI